MIEPDDRHAPRDLGEPIVHELEDDELPPSEVHQDALRVISRLSRAGHEAYLVGGCVRDLILGRQPKDFDVATAAHPRQVKRLFRNGRIIGRRFKLVHVHYGGHIVETATFRRDPDDDDSDDLLIVEDNTYGSAAEDARRRDFTINGLFLDPFGRRVLDYVGGLEDLDRRVLRTIGDPEVRMAEDPVRILRAIKFATRLGFRIEDETWSAMERHAPDLVRSAPPRVLEEILRILRSGTALGAFRMMRASGALNVLLPRIGEYLGARNDPDPAAHDRADQYWRLVEALDADVHAGNVPTAALSIAVVFLRVVEREADPATRTLPGEPGDLYTVAGEVLQPVADETRLARRDLTRARRIIANQPRFTQPQGRRFKPVLFMHGDDFDESLWLFRLRSAAWGQGWDVYEAWKERYRKALEIPSDELQQMRNRRRRGKRRRRGGRRRGGGGGGKSD